MEKREFRPHELVPYKSVWLTQEGYRTLRAEKRKRKKTIMRLVDDAVKEVFLKDGTGSEEENRDSKS